MNDAIWLPVPGYEGLYEVSSGGQVRSLLRITSCGPRGGILLNPSLNHGYPKVNLWLAGTRKSWKVHQLVMLAFVGPRPDGAETRHLDGNRLNASLANLAYGTVSENRFDAVRHGTHCQTRKTHCKNGHELTPENTLIYPGRRRCRACLHDLYLARRAAGKYLK